MDTEMLRATKLRMIRLIGIDVDGTLLDSEGRLPDENRDAIHAAIAAGVHVALVTGRSYPFARPVASTLPSSISLIVSNGAVERGMDGPAGTPCRPLEAGLVLHNRCWNTPALCTEHHDVDSRRPQRRFRRH